MILSGQYWPSFREEKIVLPEDMQSVLDKYTKAYEMTKVNRTLKWQPHLGMCKRVCVGQCVGQCCAVALLNY